MTSTTTKTRTAPAKPAAKARTAKAAPTPKAAPAKVAKPPKPEPTCLLDALTMKQTVLVKERANKTIRSLPYLCPGTEARTEAEAVAALVAAGKTLPEIADEKKVSLATARRFLTNLDLAKRVEAGEFDALWKPGRKAGHRSPRRGEACEVKVSVTVERVRSGDFAWSVLINGREAARGLIRTEAVRERWRLAARTPHN